MKKGLLLALLLTAQTTFAETDLSIPGEKWLGKYTSYLCAAFGANTVGPKTHRDLNVVFESIITDSTLDNGVLKATFESNGSVCRYSAIMLADNAAATITMVESKAYSLSEGGDCSFGKSVLDSQLAPVNTYHYYGHPHNMALMIETSEAKEVCGAEATHIGINFVVAGKVPTK
ncbi:MAG: hypothetical protein K2Q18_18205 [Bdellovibrionales bacterium]|nr:hypothetical protein [Bdellovibrionales bacterium]